MLVIVVTVIIQGILTPSADRGSFSTPLLTINGGIFQAIGVISFGTIYLWTDPPYLFLREPPEI
jgi:sodium-coupled neutral amino acid transporter 11